MATPIDHMEHRTSPHMVMGKSCGVLLQCGFPVFFSNITFYGFAGGLPDSAALCATDLTSEVCGSEVQCKTSHGHCSVPGIIKPAAVSFALFDNRHCCGSTLLYQLPFLTSVLSAVISDMWYWLVIQDVVTTQYIPVLFQCYHCLHFLSFLIMTVLYSSYRMRCSDSDN